MRIKIKKGLIPFFITLCIVSTTVTVNADSAAYGTQGYYNATIFIQNDLTKYTSYFEDAIDIWNNAGITDRSIEVNTVSSSYITNFKFSDYPEYWDEEIQEAYGFYDPLTMLPYACECHRTTSFKICMNETILDGLNYANETYNENERLGAFVHEFGHTLGLSDYGVIYNGSVMDRNRDFKTIYEPTQTDIENAIECWSPHY